MNMISTNAICMVATSVALLASCACSASEPPAESSALPTSKLVIAEMTADPAPASLPDDGCPFAVKHAVNSAVSNPAGEQLLLRWARDGQCEFNSNISFAVRIRAEPPAQARQPEDVAYNLDNPPIVERVASPGENTSILLDPTWKDSPPRPFAILFDHDRTRYFITTIGVKTSREGLLALAGHVYQRLERMPANPFPYSEDSKASLDPCSAYPLVSLKRHFAAGPLRIEQSFAEGGSCRYKGSLGKEGRSFSLTIDFDRETGPPTTFHYKFKPFKGDDTLLHQEVRTGTSGYSQHDWLVLTDAGRALINVKAMEPFPMAQAVALAENVKARVE